VSQKEHDRGLAVLLVWPRSLLSMILCGRAPVIPSLSL